MSRQEIPLYITAHCLTKEMTKTTFVSGLIIRKLKKIEGFRNRYSTVLYKAVIKSRVLDEGTARSGGKGGGEYLLVMGYWGCASGCGRIHESTDNNGVVSLAFSIELLEWGRTFSRL